MEVAEEGVPESGVPSHTQLKIGSRYDRGDKT